jgi:thioredoxin reductase (NADPH)
MLLLSSLSWTRSSLPSPVHSETYKEGIKVPALIPQSGKSAFELSANALRRLIAKDAELSDIFMRAFLLRRIALISEGLGNVIVLGSRHSSNTLRLREFLTRNGHPHRYVDLDSDKPSQELLDRFDIKVEDIPVVICSGTGVLRNPTNQKLAESLGFTSRIDRSRIHDIVIVGAGPAGLAAAVYAAFEGLDAVVIRI